MRYRFRYPNAIIFCLFFVAELFTAGFADAGFIVSSTVSFDEPGFVDQFSGGLNVDTVLLNGADTTGGAAVQVTVTTSVNIWNDQTGEKWDVASYAARSGSDRNDVTFTFTLDLPTDYDGSASNATSANVGYRLKWDNNGTFVWNHRTNSVGVEDIAIGKEVVLTSTVMFGDHISASAEHLLDITATSQNSAGNSGFEYAHLGLLDGDGNEAAGEAPELHSDAAAVAPNGWYYANSRDVIDPNGANPALTGTASSDNIQVDGTDLLASGTATNGFTLKTYWQGVDDPATLGGAFTSSLSGFTVNNAEISPGITAIPEPSTVLLMGVSSLGLLFYARRRSRCSDSNDSEQQP